MGILELKKIVLLSYPLGLSLLKYRNVRVFWNKKKSGLNRCNPLNSSIDTEINVKRELLLCTLGYRWQLGVVIEFHSRWPLGVVIEFHSITIS